MRRRPLTLKLARDLVVANRPTQAAIRRAARRGLIPPSIYMRIPPIGAHPVTSPAGNVFTYMSHADDMLARGVVWDNLSGWESTSLRVFSTLVRRAGRTLDVGAYSGIYSLLACVDGDGEAIAFEPNPSTRPFLEANVAANGLADRITVVGKGLSDIPGTTRMAIPEDTTAARIDDRGTGPPVELTTLDNILQGQKVDVIKVDVEGLEPRVLAGGRHSIETHRPALIIECLTDHTFEEVQAFLRPLGYRWCHHLGLGAPQETTRRVDMPRFANYLWTADGADPWSSPQ